jgi:hypothetical protein
MEGRRGVIEFENNKNYIQGGARQNPFLKGAP